MARIDLTEANGYIPEEEGSSVIQALLANSVVEQFARREQMATRTKSVPRFVADAPEVVAEGDVIPDAVATLDEVVLTARKYAKLFHVSEEDVNDSLVDVLNTYKTEWASRWARKYDHATLGVVSSEDGTDTAPYTSVFKAVADLGAFSTATNGDLSFGLVNDLMSFIESGDKFDAAKTVFIAHPKMLAQLRQMTGPNGDLVLPNPLAGTPGSIFGYPLVVSYGAAVDVAASATPGGPALLIAGNRDMMINGIRGGVESAVSRDAQFNTDGVVLKTRVRRAFQVADAAAFGCIQLTPAP